MNQEIDSQTYRETQNMVKNIKSFKEEFLMEDIEKIDHHDKDLEYYKQNIDSEALKAKIFDQKIECEKLYKK